MKRSGEIKNWPFNFLADEPILVSQLVRLACMHISLESVLFISSLHPLTETEIASIKELSLPFKDTAPIERSFHGERILMGQWCFESAADHGDLAALVGYEVVLKYYSSYPLRPLFNMDYATYLDLMKTYNELLETDINEALGQDLNHSKHIPKSAILTGMLLPALETIRFKIASAATLTQMTEVAIACNEYKHKHGKYPESLNVVASDVVDEATGEPFAYQNTPEAIIIYSQFDKYRGNLTVGDKKKVLGVKLLK